MRGKPSLDSPRIQEQQKVGKGRLFQFMVEIIGYNSVYYDYFVLYIRHVTNVPVVYISALEKDSLITAIVKDEYKYVDSLHKKVAKLNILSASEILVSSCRSVQEGPGEGGSDRGHHSLPRVPEKGGPHEWRLLFRHDPHQAPEVSPVPGGHGEVHQQVSGKGNEDSNKTG